VTILLVRLRLIGDVVFTTPLIRALKRARPDARISYLVEAAARPVVDHNPGLPANLTAEAARHLVDTYREYRPTHLLVTKLDEAPDDALATSVALESDLRIRWTTHGQTVPTDLAPAGESLLIALGIRIPPTRTEGRVA